ncbi:MAG: hypothetical protein UY76_C0034G0008 [Candidatus Uhrbacteria bacterium GW2011_GWA2_52_8d]|uniref:UspA domain-containing protein n=1 Tax=Candidatus Uhrbacteria bacterium GW2011_GWA2_52_8d TaxID=1618979 RepID=A0A0G1XMV6_9BACT|nr:MAG: hypothetical protein UY76_C0034G0008 [Candidatus Uhrbacteria bacterium GW2011_GWA2_52_8d]
MFQLMYVADIYGPQGTGPVFIADQLRLEETVVEKIPPGQIEYLLVDSRVSLFVTPVLPQRRDLNVLLTREVPALKLECGRCVLVPFGKGDSGVRAARLGVRLAKGLDLPVVFYHTTWRKPGVESIDGWDHLHDEARKVAQTLRGIACQQNVFFIFDIQIQAPSVFAGIIVASFKRHAAMIVMARGTNILRGSYVSQMAESSPVPLLILADEVTT